MDPVRRSRLFTLPPELLLVEEEIGISIPTLTEAQHLAPEPEEEEDDEIEDEGTLEPARIFVAFSRAVAAPEPGGDDEYDDDEEDDETEAEVEPLFRPAPLPPITAQLPTALRAESDADGSLELIAEDNDTEERPAPTATPEAPAHVQPARSVGLALVLAAAAAMLLVFWGVSAV